jgi:hypothetical protein
VDSYRIGVCRSASSLLPLPPASCSSCPFSVFCPGVSKPPVVVQGSYHSTMDDEMIFLLRLLTVDTDVKSEGRMTLEKRRINDRLGNRRFRFTFQAFKSWGAVCSLRLLQDPDAGPAILSSARPVRKKKNCCCSPQRGRRTHATK